MSIHQGSASLLTAGEAAAGWVIWDGLRSAPIAPQGSSGTKTSPGSGAITTKDGAEIFYEDWGTGQPIVFHHGWPLSADDWDAQMLFFASQGLPGHRSRPSRPWSFQPDRHRQRDGHLRRRLCSRRRPNRARFYHDVPAGPFYGYNRAGANVSQRVIDNWRRQGMRGGVRE
jgi:hypothetical protein